MQNLNKNKPFIHQFFKPVNTVAWVCIITTGILLRIINLGSRNGGFDLDEAYYILLAQGNLTRIVSDLMNGAHPPLYFILLHYWTAMFGVSEAATRMPSVILGGLLVIAVYFVGKRLFSANVGIIAMVLVSFSPLHIFYSREARMYTLLPLISLSVFFLLCRALEKNRPKDWIGLTFALIAGLYTHNYAAFLLPACAAVLLFPSFRSRARPLLATLATATVCYLPWLNVIRLQTDSSGLAWVSTFFYNLPPAAAVFRSLEVLGAGGKYPSMNYELSFLQTFRWLAAAVYASVFAGFIIKGSRVKVRIDAWTQNGHARMLLLIFLFTPLALAWAISFWVKPIYIVGRYDIISLPFYCLIIAWGINSFGPLLKRLLTVVLILLSILSLYPYYIYPVPLPDRNQAEYLENNVEKNDTIIFCGLSGNPIMVHFIRTGFSPNMFSFPAETDRHPGWLNANPDPVALDHEAQRIVMKNMSRGKRIWVVIPAKSKKNLILLNRLHEHYNIADELSVEGLSIRCFVPKGEVLSHVLPQIPLCKGGLKSIG